MTFMQDLEREVRSRLTHLMPHLSESEGAGETDEGVEELVKFFKDRVLESYRNGQAAGPRKAGQRRGGASFRKTN